MTIVRLAFSVFVFLCGLGIGALWSPMERLQTPAGRVTADARAENARLVARAREMYGEEAAEFTKQFADMTIRIKKNPIDAWASPNGRFEIRLFGSDEITASDLLYPERGNQKSLVRDYFFSNGDKHYSCSFARSVEDAKMKSVLFDFAVKEETKFIYLDSDGDSLWDRFTDLTQEPPKTYVREGPGWKWKLLPTDSPKPK